MKRHEWGFFDVLIRGGRCVSVLAGLAAACLLPMPDPAVAEEDPPVAVITHADILPGGDSAAVPPDSAPWQPVALPDYWPSTHPGADGFAWYRATLDLRDRPGDLQALYVNRLRTVGECFVNGIAVGRYGEFGVASGHASPQLFDFSPALLHPGRNTLHIRLWVGRGWEGAVGPLHVGAHAPLVAMYAQEHFLHITLTQGAAMIAAVLGAMMLMIWLGRRQDTMFGWFALAALSTAAYIATELVGVSTWVVFSLLAGPMYAPLTIYCLRYAGWRWPWLEGTVWVLAVGLGVNPGMWDTFDIGLSYEVWRSILVLLFAIPLGLTLLIAWRRSSTEAAILALAHLVSLLMVLGVTFSRPFSGIDPDLIHTLPIYLVMAWILTRRFVRALKQAETLNAELTDRVEAKRLEIEVNYLRLGELEKQRAVVDERARLMRDMHDGIGGQLISTLSLVEAGEASKEAVSAALRECIDDLRLAIDSLEPTDDDLVPVLGNLRYRIEPRLKARGIELDWQVRDVPKLAYMTPQNVLHVLRILQEAFTNVLKHAGASHVSVATRCEGGRVLIDVSDDGKGAGQQADRTTGGHGLANMRQRAKDLGGELVLQANDRGTTVTLGLPLMRVQAA